MNKRTKIICEIFARYIILLLVTLPNLFLFYTIFTPLTIYPVYFLFNLFFNCNINENIITISSCFPIELSKSCIAGSAYYLLLILNLTTPGINLKKRLILITISFASLLMLNITRIFVLGLLFVSNSSWFDLTHKLFWYLVSVFFVIGIWFTEVKLFRINKIPIYSDLKCLMKFRK